MRTLLILPLLLLAPLSVAAADPCAGANVQRIELTLDLDGVERIRFETNQFDVRLRATAAAQHVLIGDEALLDAPHQLVGPRVELRARVVAHVFLCRPPGPNGEHQTGHQHQPGDPYTPCRPAAGLSRCLWHAAPQLPGFR